MQVFQINPRTFSRLSLIFKISFVKYSLFCRSITQLIFYLFKVNNRSNRERCEICSKLTLSLFRWAFLGLLTDGEDICHAFPTVLKLCTIIPYLQKIQKIYESRNATLESCWHHQFSSKISKPCYIKKQRYRLHFDTEFLILLTFPESLKIVLINMVTISMTLAKTATPSLLKVKVFLRL